MFKGCYANQVLAYEVTTYIDGNLLCVQTSVAVEAHKFIYSNKTKALFFRIGQRTIELIKLRQMLPAMRPMESFERGSINSQIAGRTAPNAYAEICRVIRMGVYQSKGPGLPVDEAEGSMDANGITSRVMDTKVENNEDSLVGSSS